MRALVAPLVLASALAGCLSVSAPEPSSATLDAPRVLPQDFDGTIPVALDRPVFWTGPALAPTRHLTPLGGRDHGACADAARGGCPEFALDVGAGAARLRVALDHPLKVQFNRFGLELLGPDGRLLATDDGGQSNELIVEAPAAGTYLVRVRPWDVPDPADPPYALRAKLEAALPPPPPPGALMPPNLRVEPPSAFTFRMAPPLYLDVVPESIRATLSCLPDEMAEEGARRCLRFSFGYHNTGLGPMDLHFSPLTDLVGGASVVQRVYRADGSFEANPAGSYTYHKTHMHYHYDDIFAAQLLRVTDPASGALAPAGAVAKRGACAHDIMIADWESFDQAPRGSEDSGDDCSSFYGLSPAAGMRIGLSRGWADIYDWEMPSNYVEFAGQPDGGYVLRATADHNGRLLETDEGDNVGYAYIEVRGDEVLVLERGWGSDPWDPARVVATWPRHAGGTAPGGGEG